MSEEVARKIWEGNEIDNEVLRFCENIHTLRVSNQDRLNPHGKEVIEKVMAEDGVGDFIKMWRKHFIDEMQPKFLPAGWKIDHQIER